MLFTGAELQNIKLLFKWDSCFSNLLASTESCVNFSFFQHDHMKTDSHRQSTFVPFCTETVTMGRCLSGWGAILQWYAQDCTMQINVLELQLWHFLPYLRRKHVILLTHQGGIKSAWLLQALLDLLMWAAPCLTSLWQYIYWVGMPRSGFY